MEPLIILEGIKLKELLSKIDNIIQERLDEKLAEIRTPNPNKYLTRKEVAAFFRISLPTLHDWTKIGWLKSYKMGNRVLYKQDELENCLINGKVKIK